MKRIALALALSALVLSPMAMAQAPTSPGSAQPPAPSGSPGDTATQQRSATDAATIVKVDVAKVALGLRASKLVGATVVNNNDERIGTIDDLVVNPEDRVTYAIVSVGGFLGIGSKLVAVPFQQFQIVKEDRLMLPGATKEALKDLPEFKYARG